MARAADAESTMPDRAGAWGSLMRHFLFGQPPRPVALLPCGVTHAASPAPLVAGPRGTQRRRPGHGRTRPRAV